MRPLAGVPLKPAPGNKKPAPQNPDDVLSSDDETLGQSARMLKQEGFVNAFQASFLAYCAFGHVILLITS